MVSLLDSQLLHAPICSEAWQAWRATYESAEFALCLSALPPADRESVTRFVREEDKKRALVSRLLQRHVIHTLLDVPWEQIEIHRTKGGKPFVAQHDGRFPNFNYNVSHEGVPVIVCRVSE